MNTKRILEIGGIVAGAVLIVFGVVAIAMSASARGTVNDSLKQEAIVGSPDMTPSGIKAEAQQAKLPSSVSLPTCDVAGKEVTNGSEARCFASYMRIHTLEATGGLTYAQMGRYQAANGKGSDGLGGTNDEAAAVKDPKTHQPVANGRRDIWVTETALTTALNVSYMASNLALFGIVVGIALLLSGIGFVVLALIVLGAGAAEAKEAKTGKTTVTPVTS
jgi:hypothetical protein